MTILHGCFSREGNQAGRGDSHLCFQEALSAAKHGQPTKQLGILSRTISVVGNPLQPGRLKQGNIQFLPIWFNVQMTLFLSELE